MFVFLGTLFHKREFLKIPELTNYEISGAEVLLGTKNKDRALRELLLSVLFCLGWGGGHTLKGSALYSEITPGSAWRGYWALN